jgi:hypothetical protein
MDRMSSAPAAAPPRPRLLMQGVLCAVLGLSLLLAAVVRQQRLHSAARLDTPWRIGTIIVLAPGQWNTRQADDGIIFNKPAGRGPTGQSVEVWLASCPTFISPLEYLARTDDLRVRELANLRSDPERHRAALKHISIGGWPGIMLSHTSLLRTPRGVMAPRGLTLACAILPDGQAALVRLEVAGIAGDDAERLVRAFCAAITADDPPAPAAAQLQYEDGITLSPPANLLESSARDRFRIGRRLYARDQGRWMALELVPCIVAGDPRSQLASMLRLRDPGFVPGPVRQIAANTWACERANPGPGPATAYLRTHPDGRALLAEFRWVAEGADQAAAAEAMWASIQESLAFSESSPLAEWLGAGASALSGLPRDPAQLLQDADARQEWLWYHEAWPATRSTTMVHEIDEHAIACLQQTEGWVPPAGHGFELRRWRLSRSWDSYEMLIRRAGTSTAHSQSTVLADGLLQTTIYRGQVPTDVGAGTAPPTFIPGAILPLALKHLPFQPMVLQTESILWPMASVSLAPLTIVLEPSFDVPQLPERGLGEAMQCWRVRISGLTDCSRWYLDESGRLHSISFADGVRLQRLRNTTQPGFLTGAALSLPASPGQTLRQRPW